jgi:hypothetical protein
MIVVGSFSTSKTIPPAKRVPTKLPSRRFRRVWHSAQTATAVARYSPRSTVGSAAGLVFLGVLFGPMGSIANAMTALPTMFRSCCGIARFTGFCERRNDSRAVRSSSERSWYSMKGSAARPSGITP